MPAREDPTPPATTRGAPSIPIWVGVIAAVAAVGFGIGGLIAAVDPELLTGGINTDGAAIYVDYTISRDLALAVTILCMLAFRARRVLAALLLLAALVQIADLVQDAVQGRVILALGVAVLGALFLAAGARLADYAPWRAAIWRDSE